MTERLLTPSKITVWLDCAHFLTLRHQVDDGTLTLDRSQFGPFAQLLVDKGLDHEAECLAEYRRQGRSVLEVPATKKGRVIRSLDRPDRRSPCDRARDVIYQMPFIHGGVRGIADFLVRVEHPGARLLCSTSRSTPSWPVPRESRATCSSSASTPTPSRRQRVAAEIDPPVAGIGSYPVTTGQGVSALLESAAVILPRVIDDEQGDGETYPEPCAHCEFCEFHDTLHHEWRESDSLTFVAGIRSADRVVWSPQAWRRWHNSRYGSTRVEGLQPERLRRLVDQASLQVQTQLDPRGAASVSG